MNNPIGIYEKALPKDMNWAERFAAAKAAGYDFLEISVDETPERMARLDWSLAERLGTRPRGLAGVQLGLMPVG